MFDKPSPIVYKIDMNTPTRSCLVLWLLLVAVPAAALPLSTRLAFAYEVPLLSQDLQIGQLVEPKAGSSEAYTAKALSEPYTLEWVETYVAEDVRFSFVRTFDRELSLLLPQTKFSLGKAVRREESIAVPFRYAEDMRYGTFVWIEVSEGLYTLVSISLNP